jgi:type IX secretion system PorP/SprF family membrane protein
MRNILKLFLPIIVLGLISFKSKGQDPQFSQFYANPLYLNPALAGADICPRISLNYRNQWPQLAGNFVTYSASFDQHVDALSGGLGILVLSDDAGAGTLRTNRVSLIYSYLLQINRKVSLRAGFEATYFDKSLDWSRLTFGDMIDPRKGFIFNTEDVPRGDNVRNADISVGTVIYADEWFAGFSVHHLNTPNESLVVGESNLPMRFTVHAGYELPLFNTRGKARPNVPTIAPNIIYMRQGDFQQLNMGAYVRQNSIVGGLWYRWGDSFIVSAGIQTDTFRIGYSYDLTVSDLTTRTGGAHEISYGHIFGCKSKKRKFRAIKCPSF